MELQRLLTGDPSRTSTLYIALGAISLAKAIALRNDSTRFRRELVDAGLFLGVGLALRRYGKLKAQKQAELRESLPAWVAGGSGGSSGSSGSGGGVPVSEVRRLARSRLGGEPEPEPSLRERAMQVVGGR